jgi:hypothetical protein
LGVSGEGDTSSIVIKNLINYFQIVSSIKTLGLKFPNFINNIQSVSNPIEQSTYALDCWLGEIST